MAGRGHQGYRALPPRTTLTFLSGESQKHKLSIISLSLPLSPSFFMHIILQCNLYKTPMGQKKSVTVSEGSSFQRVEMHARVVLGVGKGVLFREVSSVQGCPYKRGSTVLNPCS